MNKDDLEFFGIIKEGDSGNSIFLIPDGFVSDIIIRRNFSKLRHLHVRSIKTVCIIKIKGTSSHRIAFVSTQIVSYNLAMKEVEIFLDRYSKRESFGNLYIGHCIQPSSHCQCDYKGLSYYAEQQLSVTVKKILSSAIPYVKFVYYYYSRPSRKKVSTPNELVQKYTKNIVEPVKKSVEFTCNSLNIITFIRYIKKQGHDCSGVSFMTNL
jgi:hypothetical protein